MYALWQTDASVPPPSSQNGRGAGVLIVVLGVVVVVLIMRRWGKCSGSLSGVDVRSPAVNMKLHAERWYVFQLARCGVCSDA